MSEKEINIMLEKERLEVKSTQKISRKVLIKAVDGKHYTKLFNSISDCIAYLNNIAPSNKTTLYRHIKSERPYNGYFCQ
jgi:hypothetical protein